MGVAAAQLKKNGSFKIAGALNLKLKQKPATPARKGVDPRVPRTLHLSCVMPTNQRSWFDHMNKYMCTVPYAEFEFRTNV